MKTIKLLAVTMLFTIAAVTVKAQSTDITFGVKAGVSISTLKTGLNAVTDKSGKIGFNAGIFARTGDNLYFQPEVNYATFSNKYNFNASAYDAKFSMINVPLLVGYKLVTEKDMNFRISAGPDLYYDLKKTAAPAGFGYKKFSAGGAADVGVDFGNLTLDARYSLGLSNVNKNLGQKANIFSAAIGFKFQ
ncbi:MAG TPA: porin family protein [Mucilaginibacter sp.]